MLFMFNNDMLNMETITQLEQKENIKKRKHDVYSKGDIILLDEERCFGYCVETVKNEGGIFTSNHYVFNCCGQTISRNYSKKDFSTLLDHIKESHDAIAIKSVENDDRRNIVKVSYVKKCVL